MTIDIDIDDLEMGGRRHRVPTQAELESTIDRGTLVCIGLIVLLMGMVRLFV
jgi:hypothetical protein